MKAIIILHKEWEIDTEDGNFKLQEGVDLNDADAVHDAIMEALQDDIQKVVDTEDLSLEDFSVEVEEEDEEEDKGKSKGEE